MHAHVTYNIIINLAETNEEGANNIQIKSRQLEQFYCPKNLPRFFISFQLFFTKYVK